MAQSQNQPLYWDKDRVPVNLTLILALGIALWGLGGSFGLIPFGGNPQLIVLLGVGVAVYTWLMTPRQYLVYADALCIVYGRPRVKVMRFSDIDTVELGSVAALDRLRVRPLRGRRQSIRVREVESFYEHLAGALQAFRQANPEYAPADPMPAVTATPESPASGAAATATDQPATAAAEPEPAAANDDVPASPAAAANPDNATDNPAAAANPGDIAGESSETAANDAGIPGNPATEPPADPPPPEHRPIY